MATLFAGGNTDYSVFRFRRNGPNFDKPYVFGVNNTIIIGTHGAGGFDNNGAQNLRVKPGNLEEAAFDGGKGPFAQWETELSGDKEKVRIKSKKTGKYLRIMNGKVDVGGGQGKFTLFKVHKMHAGPVAQHARLQSVEEGTFLNCGPQQFVKPYLFGKVNTVVMRHPQGKFLRVDPGNLEKLDGEGGKGAFAQWEAQPQANGSECKFKSKKSGKYLRIGPQGNLNVGGGGGPFTVFKVHKQGKDGKVKLESKKHGGKYPAYQPGKGIAIGNGGQHTVLEIFRIN